jgi:RNA polymerase sigma-70 factor, ECF subfamily
LTPSHVTIERGISSVRYERDRDHRTMLEQLSPAERTAFVLHDVFDVPFGDVAEVVGRTPEAVRQLASRARRHVKRERPRFAASRDEHDRAVQAFAQAVAEGDLEGPCSRAARCR